MLDPAQFFCQVFNAGVGVEVFLGFDVTKGDVGGIHPLFEFVDAAKELAAPAVKVVDEQRFFADTLGQPVAYVLALYGAGCKVDVPAKLHLCEAGHLNDIVYLFFGNAFACRLYQFKIS